MSKEQEIKDRIVAAAMKIYRSTPNPMKDGLEEACRDMDIHNQLFALENKACDIYRAAWEDDHANDWIKEHCPRTYKAILMALEEQR